MIGSELAFSVGLVALGVALLAVLWAWWRETSTLKRLMSPATRADAITKLPAPLGDAAATLERALTAKMGIDDGLSASIIGLSQADLGRRWPGGLVSDAVIVLSVIGPLSVSLLSAADQVAQLREALVGLEGPTAYTTAVLAIPAAFAGLGRGAVYSAVLVFIAAVVAVTRYALLRPEARETRAIHAFVHGTAATAPSVNLPHTARLLGLLAPSTSLRPAALASVAFVVLSGAAMLVLRSAQDIRLANAVPLAYSGWPRLHIESGDVTPPVLAAGRALANGPSLIVGRDRIQLGAQTVTGLDDGELILGWEAQAIAATLPDATRPLLVAGSNAPLGTLLGVMTFLQSKGATEFQLVVDRRLPPHGTPAVQAAIPLALGEVSEGPTTIDIEPTGVRIGSSAVKLSQLRERVAASKAATFGVRVIGPITYGQLVEVLAAADGVCETDSDCGLPGRGLRFVLQVVAPAPE